MLFNYLLVASRNLKRNKVYSFINISGLALGIAAFLLVLEYVSFERSFNRFHEDLPRLYRLLNEDKKGITWPEIEPGWAVQLKAKYPEIDDYCRFETGVAQGVVKLGVNGPGPFRETNIGYAEGNFFRFFNFPLVAGDPQSFNHPDIVFLSAPAAKKYFGKLSPIGKTLQLNNQFGSHNYLVQGVYELPENSDIRYDMVFSLETLKNPANLNGNDWAATDNLGSQYIQTIFRLKENTDHKRLENRLTQLRDQLGKENDGVRFRLQPMTDIHLAASLSDNFPTNGNLKYVYILSIISVLILVIAWSNYVNLSTANSLKRANEVGVRKIVGASRSMLILQFLCESLLVNILALAAAIFIVLVLQPWFNVLIGRNISLGSIIHTSAWISGIGLLLAGSLGTGFYTAYVLTGFKPVHTLKNKIVKTASGALLRKSLVVGQFAISIGLILATVLIYRQLNYMQQKQLGIKTQEMMVIRGPELGRDSTFRQRKSSFLNEIARQNFVQSYSQSGIIPGGGYNFMTSGFTQPGSLSGDEFKSYSFAIIDEKYLPAYEVKLKAGRNFTAAECAVDWDANSKVLLNERAVEELGFASAEDALRIPVQWDERKLLVIGVIRDYHHTGLQRRIDPMIFYPQNNGQYYSVRIGTENLQQNISKLETIFKEQFPGNPFEFFFADEHFNRQYASEQQYSRLFTAASVWAIVIACLGLFGLTTFAVTSRIKEIGIRKVLGASVTDITTLLSRDFVRLILLATTIAFPLTWWAMHNWLQNFSYRISIGWWVFVAAGLAVLLLAVGTISIQAIRAALSNPSKSLRTE